MNIFKKLSLVVGVLVVGLGLSSTFAWELNSSNVGSYCAISATGCDLQSYGITSIASGTFVGYSTLKSLIFLGLTGIENGDFAGLSNLQSLSIHSDTIHKITSLESGDFNGLSNLERLNLDQNHITSLENGDFAGLPNLRSLNIQNNGLTSIESGDFAGLSNLGELWIVGNQITSIESGDFFGLSSLTGLYIDGNQITSIESGDFSGLPNLKRLQLGDNQLTNIESGSFIGLINLIDLSLYNNQISNIEVGAFAGLSNIMYLGLGGNQLTSTGLHAGSFAGPQYTFTLNLSNNYLTFIKKNFFDGLSRNLTHLSLYNNQIDHIEHGAFNNLSNNLNLYVSDNCLDADGLDNRALAAVMRGNGGTFPTQTESCVLDYDGVVRQSNIVYMYDCPLTATYCDLSNWKISSIESGAFLHHGALQQLDLYTNQITGIENGDFVGLSSLNMLNLNENFITTIPSYAFNGLSNLNELYMEINNVTSIESGDFAGLSNLTTLDLYGNKITSINNGGFNGLSSVTYINLSQNLITSLENGDFVGLSNLVDMEISDNRITTIGKNAFAGLENMVGGLYLNNNHITSIESGDLTALSHLGGLNLYNNWISNVKGVDVSILPNLGYLDLGSNCNIGGVEDIPYAGGTATIDQNNCILTYPTAGSFINDLTNKGYGLNNGYYQGSNPILVTPGNNTIRSSLRMISTNTDGSLEAYYQNPVEVTYPTNTNLTTQGQAFSGVLISPILINTGETQGLTKVTTLTKFGDTDQRINFSQPVTVKMPALGKNIGDSVNIFSTEIIGTPWEFHTTATIFDDNGTPYIQFTTTHATYYAIAGAGTGTFVINNDASTTNSLSVNLNIVYSVSGAKVRFSNDGNSWSTWEDYIPTKSWTLSPGIGSKTVYMQVDSNNDTISDQEVTDTISYVLGSSGTLSGTQGDIKLQILSGSSHCIYGTALDLGRQAIASNFGALTFTGDFLTASGSSTWSCTDFAGTPAGRDLTIQTSDLDNGSNNFISGSNVKISHSPSTLVAGNCLTGDTSAADTSINTIHSIIAKQATSQRSICTIQATNVQLKVDVPPNQAPGKYTATLTITLPSFN